MIPPVYQDSQLALDDRSCLDQRGGIDSWPRLWRGTQVVG